MRQATVKLERERIVFETFFRRGGRARKSRRKFREDRLHRFHDRSLPRFEEAWILIELQPNYDLSEKWICSQQQQVGLDALGIVYPDDRVAEFEDRRIIIVHGDPGGGLVS